MKKYLFLILLLASSLFAMSQTLSVASFELAPTDATAVTHGTKKSDASGRTCALIKVQSTLRGLNFETGSLGLCDADGAAIIEKTGETWVYVPAGTVKLTILHKDFLPLRNYQWGYSLEGGKTYILNLVGGTVRTIVEQEVCQQYVVFNVTPPDALVTFDGNILDVNKGVAKKLVACGTYDYRVEAKKYHTDAGKVSVSDPSAKKVVTVNLRPAVYGMLDITSTPDGATVMLDGKNVGETPLYLSKVLEGDHKISLSKQGCLTKDGDVSVSEGKLTEYSAELPYTITVNGVSFEMVWVEGGTFQMGSNSGKNDEKPVHSVTLDGYYIGKYEVTQAQWLAVMGSNPSPFKGNNNPVGNVSWDDCQQFVSKLNQLTGRKFSLPTEAQWEYAARGGSKSKGYTYSGGNIVDDVAWYDDNSNSRTHPVGTKVSNELGVYDMSGNVWEWCLDWYDGDYYSNSPDRNPDNNSAASYCVFRGGGWSGDAEDCRVTDRSYFFPASRYHEFGVRLVLLP